MGRMGPGHTSMAICSCMLMVAFSPRRRRVMQAARSRPGVARPGPARPRPGGGSAGPAGRGGGCGRRRRRPQDGLTLLLPARRRRARVSARGRQAGGGPSPRHPAATKQCECAGCAGGAERASRAAPHPRHTARTPARDPARAHSGGRATGAPSTHAWSQDKQGAHSARSSPRQRSLGPALSHRTHAAVQGRSTHTQTCADTWWKCPLASMCRTHTQTYIHTVG